MEYLSVMPTAFHKICSFHFPAIEMAG